MRKIIIPQCGWNTPSKDKGAIPTVLYYSDNRRKAITNELGRPYERRHISIHYLQRDALLHYALQRMEILSSKFLLTFLRILIRFPASFVQAPFYICQTRLDRDETTGDYGAGQADATLIYLRIRRAMLSAKLRWRNDISIRSERIVGQRADITMQIRDDTIAS